MCFYLLFCLLALVGGASGGWFGGSVRAPTVAIVGGGIGGAAVAHYLHELSPDATITVYEKHRVGGRVRTERFRGARGPEVGASAWHSSHRLISEIVDKLGLEKKHPYSDSAHFAIWNGREVVMHSSSSSLRTVYNMLWRYGLSPLYAKTVISEATEGFAKVYSLLESGKAWDTHEGALRSIGLYGLAQRTLRGYLRDKGFNAAFLDEMVEGIVRNNYGQALSDVNALAGLLALAGGSDELWCAHDGNAAIVEGLLRRSDAVVRNYSTVTSVVGPRDGVTGKIKVKYYETDQSTGSTTEKEDVADYVVVAASLDLAGVEIDAPGVPQYQFTANLSKYNLIHMTVVSADRLSPHYFKLLSTDEEPNVVVTMEEEVSEFLSLGTASLPLVHGQKVYKVLSRDVLLDDTLDRIFTNRTEAVRHTWHAYPRLAPTESFPPVTIAPRVYYLNGLEYVVPSMEASAIAAKNLASLMLQHWKEHLANPVDEEHPPQPPQPPQTAPTEPSPEPPHGIFSSPPSSPPPESPTPPPPSPPEADSSEASKWWFSDSPSPSPPPASPPTPPQPQQDWASWIGSWAGTGSGGEDELPDPPPDAAKEEAPEEAKGEGEGDEGGPSSFASWLW